VYSYALYELSAVALAAKCPVNGRQCYGMNKALNVPVLVCFVFIAEFSLLNFS
jgi:hypothetical protein